MTAGGNRKGYAGYENDGVVANACIYHVRHRPLHVLLARWLRRDPLGYVASINLMEYGDANPLRSVDYYGQQSFPPSGSGGEPPLLLSPAPGGIGLPLISGCPPTDPGPTTLNDGWCCEGFLDDHCGLRCYAQYNAPTTIRQQCCYNADRTLNTNPICAGTIDDFGPAEGEIWTGGCNWRCVWPPYALGHLIIDYGDYVSDPDAYVEFHCCLRNKYKIPSGTPGMCSVNQYTFAYKDCAKRIKNGEKFCGFGPRIGVIPPQWIPAKPNASPWGMPPQIPRVPSAFEPLDHMPTPDSRRRHPQGYWPIG